MRRLRHALRSRLLQTIVMLFVLAVIAGCGGATNVTNEETMGEASGETSAPDAGTLFDPSAEGQAEDESQAPQFFIDP